jgi:hypothetical protein
MTEDVKSAITSVFLREEQSYDTRGTLEVLRDAVPHLTEFALDCRGRSSLSYVRQRRSGEKDLDPLLRDEDILPNIHCCKLLGTYDEIKHEIPKAVKLLNARRAKKIERKDGGRSNDTMYYIPVPTLMLGLQELSEEIMSEIRLAGIALELEPQLNEKLCEDRDASEHFLRPYTLFDSRYIS